MRRYETTVGNQAAGFSLIRAMRRAWPLLPERAIRDALRNKDVQLNRVRVSENVPVAPGDRIVLYTACAMREIPVVFEDERFLLVNKPAGLNTDRNAGSGLSLIGWAQARAAGEYEPQLCHRLDNQTSGLCLLAKEEAAAQAAKSAFRARDVIKLYECLVRGVPSPAEAVHQAWLNKDAGQARVTVSGAKKEGSREIITGYRVLAASDPARLSVRLYTGRTHQIRAHLAFLGHPVLGDDLYGDRAWNRAQGQPGLRLCAVSLAFPGESGVESLQGRTFQISAPF